MKTTHQELEEIENQIQSTLEPLQKKKREIVTKLEQEGVDKRKKEFNNLVGKVFYAKKSPYKGSSICLIKPLSCTDFSSEYNSCNVIEIQIEEYENKNLTINFKYDTHRVDSILLMEETTLEFYEKVKNAIEFPIWITKNNFKNIK